MENSDKLILHLCCSDEMSDTMEYNKAGYTVIPVNQLIGVENYNPPKNTYGIIANPPCTEFAVSGARWWKSKGDSALIEALKPVIHCLRIIAECSPVFWVIENPVGRLKDFIGKPKMYYQPCDYGDNYTKKTCLWGKFNIPLKNPVEPTEGSKMHLLPPSNDRSKLRSICSPGFAKAFFEANQ